MSYPPRVPRAIRPLEGLGRAAVLPLAVVLFGAASGAAAYVGVNHSHVALVVAAGLIAPLPIVLRIVQGRFDPFEPIHIVAIGVLLFFVARPATELVAHINVYVGGLVPRSGFDGAMLIAIVGTLCIYLGYAVPWGRALAWRAPQLPEAWDRDRSVRFAIILLVLAAVLTVPLAAALGGFGPLLNVFRGRTSQSYVTSTATVGYILYAPILTIPAALILLVAFMGRRTFGVGVLLAVTAFLSLAITVPRGDRTFIVAVALALLVTYYLRRGRRPTAIALVLFLVAGMVAINVSLELRNVQRREQLGVFNTITHAITHPGHEISQFMTGVDTSEFTVLELEYQALNKMNSLDLDFHPGTTVKSIVEGPIPRQILGSKAKAGSEYVDQYLFPVQGAAIQGTGPRGSFAPSPFGDIFADAGWISLVFYSLLTGIVLRVLWEYLQRFPGNEGFQLVFAESLALTVVLMRGSIPNTLARAIFLLIPLVLCLVLCSRPAERTRGRSPRRPVKGVPSRA